MVIGMIGYDMPFSHNPSGDIGVLNHFLSDTKKSGLDGMPGQHIQNCRCRDRVRSIVKGDGNTHAALLPTADRRAEEAKTKDRYPQTEYNKVNYKHGGKEGGSCMPGGEKKNGSCWRKKDKDWPFEPAQQFFFTPSSHFENSL